MDIEIRVCSDEGRPAAVSGSEVNRNIFSEIVERLFEQGRFRLEKGDDLEV